MEKKKKIKKIKVVKQSKKQKDKTPTYSKIGDVSETGLHSNITNLKKPGEYLDFLLFMAIPDESRNKIFGCDTQYGFADKVGVAHDQVSDWKKRDGFWKDVFAIRKDFFKERTSEILHAVYKKAKRTGDAAEAKTLLQYTGELKEETSVSFITPELDKAIAKINNMLG